MIIVHILFAGRALCKPGTPNTWAENERWVDKNDISLITCKECSRIWKELTNEP